MESSFISASGDEPPYPPNGHRVLHSVVGVLIGLGVDVHGETLGFEFAFNVLQVVDLEAEMIDAFPLIFPLDLDERDVDIAIDM